MNQIVHISGTAFSRGVYKVFSSVKLDLLYSISASIGIEIQWSTSVFRLLLLIGRIKKYQTAY